MQTLTGKLVMQPGFKLVHPEYTYRTFERKHPAKTTIKDCFLGYPSVPWNAVHELLRKNHRGTNQF
jgi:hypothetical protein